jgi:hypothetical protein
MERENDIITLFQILHEDLGEDGARLGEGYLNAVMAWVQARIRRTVQPLRNEQAMGDIAEWSALDERATEILSRCSRAAPFVHCPGDRSDKAIRFLVDAVHALAS